MSPTRVSAGRVAARNTGNEFSVVLRPGKARLSCVAMPRMAWREFNLRPSLVSQTCAISRHRRKWTHVAIKVFTYAVRVAVRKGQIRWVAGTVPLEATMVNNWKRSVEGAARYVMRVSHCIILLHR